MRGFVRQENVELYSKHELYHTWRMMNIRCYDPSYTYFKNYGGRGIEVCCGWKYDNNLGFYNFLKSVGTRPIATTLDRKNPNGNYEFSNCKWSTKKQQQNNLSKQLTDECCIRKEGNRHVVYAYIKGISHSVYSHKDFEKCVSFKKKFLQNRIKDGDDKTLEKIIENKTTPTNKRLRWNKTSKYYGVSWDTSRNKWRAMVSYRKSKNTKLINKFIGRYDDERDAMSAVSEFLNHIEEYGYFKEIKSIEKYSV